jgi:FHS family L-fucose permease-like MFS transporter
LTVFSGMVGLLLAVAVFAGGTVAMWCIVGVGLFTSIGWSNIFALAIEGVGIYKSQASSLLVMAVMGGAVLPAILGRVADQWGLQVSFVIPLLAYLYVAFYGAKGHRIGRRSHG